MDLPTDRRRLGVYKERVGQVLRANGVTPLDPTELAERNLMRDAEQAPRPESCGCTRPLPIRGEDERVASGAAVERPTAVTSDRHVASAQPSEPQ